MANKILYLSRFKNMLTFFCIHHFHEQGDKNHSQFKNRHTSNQKLFFHWHCIKNETRAQVAELYTTLKYYISTSNYTSGSSFDKKNKLPNQKRPKCCTPLTSSSANSNSFGIVSWQIHEIQVARKHQPLLHPICLTASNTDLLFYSNQNCQTV